MKKKIKKSATIFLLNFMLFTYTEKFHYIFDAFSTIGVGILLFWITGFQYFFIFSLIVYPFFHYYTYKRIKNSASEQKSKLFFENKLTEIKKGSI